LEGNAAALAEIDQQISESKDHAAVFQAALDTANALKATLEKAQKRFAALTKVEERHAQHYKSVLATLAAK
jgi:rubrerythrin